MLPPDIDALFAATLHADYDDEEAWNAVSILQRTGTREVFDKAVAWTQSPDPRTRERGLDIIAQIGKTAEHPSHGFPQESYEAAASIVRRETEPGPLSSAITVLGYVGEPSAIPLIAAFRSHPNEDVRFNTACALGQYPEDPLSIRTLLLLTDDAAPTVRDWATFALGTLSTQDTPEIRIALLRRIEDDDANTRGEAFVGLANRRDVRIVSRLIAELEQPEVTLYFCNAAARLLGFDQDQEDWSCENYISALRERFPQS